MTLAHAHRHRTFVDIVLKFDDEEVDGVILNLSDQWCLLASIESFEPDGYWIVRKDLIKQIRHRRYETFRHKILQADGTLATLCHVEGLDISSTPKLFSSLIALQRYAVIHRDTEAEWWDHHAALVSMEAGYLTMHSFDGAGRFNKNFSRCQIADITSIRLGSRYLNAYQKAAPYDFERRQPSS